MRNSCWCSRCVAMLIIASCLPRVSLVFGESAAARVVTGKVVDSKGSPVPNADVYCCAYVHNRFPTVKGRSGADGTFTINIPPPDNFALSNDRLWAIAPGYSGMVTAVPDSKKEMASVQLVLFPASDFRVAVKLQMGNPRRTLWFR